jgi:hypothetical protein
MPGMQWHRLSRGDAAGATGAQNLSGAVQELRRQRTPAEAAYRFNHHERAIETKTAASANSIQF